VTTGAAAIVFDPDGRVLVVKENYGRYRWSLPGGAVEDGETPEQACVREAREETGAEVEVRELVGRYGLVGGFESYAFVCEVAAGEPALQPTGELSDVCWLAPADIPQPQSNILHYALPDALAGKRDLDLDALPRVS
jgi:8-oxo-dGTP pyrophosphatase MutT (NUDIX family)